MNTARRDQWKQAVTFQTDEITTVGHLVFATLLSISSFLWPEHRILAFAIICLTYSAVFQFVFTRTEDRRLLKALLWNAVAIAIFAAFIHYNAR